MKRIRLPLVTVLLFLPLILSTGPLLAQATTVTITGSINFGYMGYHEPTVTVQADNGASVTVDKSGYYYTVTVPVGWSGTITPSCKSYFFDPGYRTYSNVTKDISDQKFHGESLPFVGISSGYWDSCGVSWGDFDRDGFLELNEQGTHEDMYGRYYPISTIISFVTDPYSVYNYSATDCLFVDNDNDGDSDYGTYRKSDGVFLDFDADRTPLTGQCDINNDGLIDRISETATSSTSAVYEVYRNDGNAVFTKIQTIPSALISSNIVFADFDKDGDVDFTALGWRYQANVWQPFCKFYKNSSGTFSLSSNLPGVVGRSVAWGDCDNDGDLDFVALGDTSRVDPYSQSPNCKTKLFINNGSGVFAEKTASGLPVFDGNTRPYEYGRNDIDLGDYDNDGDLDLIVLEGCAPCICNNDGHGVFTYLGTVYAHTDGGAAQWGDYNNDGRLDLVVCGFIDGACVFRNIFTKPNAPPSAPTNLRATTGPNSIKFSWNAASDDKTPSLGLTYNLRVGTAPGASNIVSCATLPSGRGLAPAFGNVQNNLSWTLNGLPSGTYYWAVQAIDSSYASSAWAESRVGPEIQSLASIKDSIDGQSVSCCDKVVSAVFDDSFYVEQLDRSSGIKVYKPGYNVSVGRITDVSGTVEIDPISGECQIRAASVFQRGNSTVQPLGLNNLHLGGGDQGLQSAAWSWKWIKDTDGSRKFVFLPSCALSNIGLLVRVWGKVTQVEETGQYFYIDDGSHINDGTLTGTTPNVGIRIARDGRAYTPGQFVSISGISSCFKGQDLKLRSQIK